jgi:hypothetical protein
LIDKKVARQLHKHINELFQATGSVVDHHTNHQDGQILLSHQMNRELKASDSTNGGHTHMELTLFIFSINATLIIDIIRYVKFLIKPTIKE